MAKSQQQQFEEDINKRRPVTGSLYGVTQTIPKQTEKPPPKTDRKKYLRWLRKIMKRAGQRPTETQIAGAMGGRV